MQIFIKLLNGESFSLDVEQNETIEDVKIKILEKKKYNRPVVGI